ncbi:MAG: AAA family ATPase [Defluviitaleaceae bacterium]|nr:AAA family ATPase [Defluviitaleaceae bacterium]
MKKLDYTQLKKSCNPEGLGFKTTAELCPKKAIIGQKRAVDAFDFAFATRREGYNIYVSGMAGCGKTSFATHFAKIAAEKEDTPKDLAYVYNFKDPKSPKLLTFNPGYALSFKEDLAELLEVLNVEIPKLFETKEYEEQKADILKKFDNIKEDQFKVFSEESKTKGFEVRFSDRGISFDPIVDGAILNIDDFSKLPEADREEITATSKVIHENATKLMDEFKRQEKQARSKISEIDYNLSLFAVGHHISRLQEKYIDEDAPVLAYLADLKENILENIESFGDLQELEEDDALSGSIPWALKKTKEDVMKLYKINIIASHKGTKHAPVEVASNATYAGIMGEIEYDSEFGNLTTDYMKIKGGLLHKANGGYIILQAGDVLSIPFLWDALKRAIKSQKILIENPKEHQMGVPVAGIKPEAIAFDTKIILVGDNYYYDLLSAYDGDFVGLFKALVPFDYEMDYTQEHLTEICRFIKSFVEDEGLFDLTACGVAQVIEYSGRLAESQKKLTGQFDQLANVLIEAYIWAKKEGVSLIDKAHIQKAITQKEYRLGLYEEKITQMMEDGSIMIETTGGKIGEINALAAIDTGGTVFAKPSKVTATTYVGKAGIINIENEAQMSGEIHDKGVQIVIGYLGQKYAQNFPLSLSCRVCFEQNYTGIDGDSASSTELYAILSSLANLPINQEIAVTGSINQKGEIQPVGAITVKIEGFFDLCQSRGLTGSQGVIIPAQNTLNLFLKDEVIEAVREGKFHIYPISHIDEGMEILMSRPAGDVGEESTLHNIVYKRLQDFNEKASDE